MKLLLIVFILAVVIVVAELLYLYVKRKGEPEKLPYRLLPYFFNKSEMAFFLELKKALPDGYHIFSKVRIIDFIEPTDKTNYAKWRNKIWAKHVDFLICDQQSKPVVAIEVDGKSHQSMRRKERDRFIGRVFTDTGLRLERVPVGTDFSEVIQKIFSRK